MGKVGIDGHRSLRHRKAVNAILVRSQQDCLSDIIFVHIRNSHVSYRIARIGSHCEGNRGTRIRRDGIQIDGSTLGRRTLFRDSITLIKISSEHRIGRRHGEVETIRCCISGGSQSNLLRFIILIHIR